MGETYGVPKLYFSTPIANVFQAKTAPATSTLKTNTSQLCMQYPKDIPNKQHTQRGPHSLHPRHRGDMRSRILKQSYT